MICGYAHILQSHKKHRDHPLKKLTPLCLYCTNESNCFTNACSFFDIQSRQDGSIEATHDIYFHIIYVWCSVKVISTSIKLDSEWTPELNWIHSISHNDFICMVYTVERRVFQWFCNLRYIIGGFSYTVFTVWSYTQLVYTAWWFTHHQGHGAH